MLAIYLLESWNNSEKEKEALRMAVGLDTPDKTFWKPLGEATLSITPRDKINFLARTIAFIGSDDLNEDLLNDLPSFLVDIIALIKLQLSNQKLNEADFQLLGTELIICEYFTSKKNSSATQAKIRNFIRDKNFANNALRLLGTLQSRWEVIAVN